MITEAGAKIIAKLAHKGQLYGREDYYTAHIKPLVEMVRIAGGNKHAIVAAYLHDVVEDTELTLDDLAALGVDMEVIYTLKAITRTSDIEYLKYIQNLKSNKNAVLIKKLDLQLNLANSPRESLRARYIKALEILN